MVLRRRFSVCVALIFSAVILNEAIAQTQAVIDAVKDNTLYEDATGNLSNGSGWHFFAGKTNTGSIRRGLIAFDVASNVPAGATITNVMLTLNMSKSVNIAGQTVNLHRALADWGEGISDAGGEEGGGQPATATTGDATWLHRFFNTQLWATPGGEFSQTPSADLTVAGVGSYTWATTSQLVSDVQGWLDTPSNNFGWVLVGNEENNQTAKRFDSKDNTNASVRPKLTVIYTPPVTSVGDEQNTPVSFSLEQNYPNPFNPTTVIRFQLPTAGYVRLSVFNLFGQEVATLASGNRSAGSHIVGFNAQDLSSGVYLYRLTAGAFSVTKKLVLMR